MAAIALMLEIFLFLRLIVTVPAVAAVTITSAAQWSIEEAWVGYISTAGSCECTVKECSFVLHN
jgi:hypothetical protein